MNWLDAHETQITHQPGGHVLTNIGVWSPDSQWVVYDVRSDPAGAVFDGTRIERVHVSTGKVETLLETAHGAKCGVVTYSPVEDRVAFIHGPERPTADWQYAANHRRGVIVDVANPGQAINIDARDISPPFTPGALRGGTHVHVFSGDGCWISFTYQDHVLAEKHLQAKKSGADTACELDQRNVGVSLLGSPVRVSRNHPRNHDGTSFSVLVTRTTDQPTPGSDQIRRAYEDAWVGIDGYVRSDHTRQRHALAFQGEVIARDGRSFTEAFIVDLPEDITRSGAGPLAGTKTCRPCPPEATIQCRLTYTADRTYPGLQGPRHWLRSSPDGSRIAMLMKDEDGIVQIWTVSPNGGQPIQVTRDRWSIASAFSWCPAGRRIAYVADNSVCVVQVESGRSTRLTPRSTDDLAPRAEACVFSPDGQKIAYVRNIPSGTDHRYNQIFVLSLESA